MVDKGCVIEGCVRKHYGRGWCHTHYMRWYKRGDPSVVLVTQGNPMERLRQKYEVDEASGCWVWNSNVRPDGYGQFWYNGGARYAHAVSYELHVGPIPGGLHLDHLCHTVDETCVGGWPCLHRRCVNPAHLEPVTRVENVRRAQRNNPQVKKTHCPQGHPYSGPNLYVSARGDRMCRTCRGRRRDRSPIVLDAKK